MIEPAHRAALVLTALPFLTLGLAHVALRFMKMKPGRNLILVAILMVVRLGSLASVISALYFGLWLAGKYLDPAASAAFKAEPRSIVIFMGSAMLAYLYLIVRWCWQVWALRRTPQESAP